MNIFQKIIYVFLPYTDPRERRVAAFFRRVSERDSPHKLEKPLRKLLQRDIAVVNLWTEHRYKNYRYLTKRTRRELYQNLARIHEDFAAFEAEYKNDTAVLISNLRQMGVDTAQLSTKQAELGYLEAIMRYLTPRAGRYEYQTSSSFGKLLRDPSKESLIGDCNQIVTLYLSLYAARYDISDLALTVFPGHVALHFYGVDVEATSGRFTLYDKPDQRVVPVQEIVSINLLDTSDTNFEKAKVSPEAFLESSRLAYVVSSNRQVVKKNLEIAYQQIVRHSMQASQYQKAFLHAKQSKDHELVQLAAHNGAVYELQRGNFAQARAFAGKSTRKQELFRTINSHEAAALYKRKSYDAARKLYEHIGDRDMVAQCYRALYAETQKQLAGVKTTKELASHASTVRTMHRYAKLAGDAKLIQHAQSLLKQM